MKNLENFNTSDLTVNEISSIYGGDGGNCGEAVRRRP